MKTYVHIYVNSILFLQQKKNFFTRQFVEESTKNIRRNRFDTLVAISLQMESSDSRDVGTRYV